jgi:hypothetical protein
VKKKGPANLRSCLQIERRDEGDGTDGEWAHRTRRKNIMLGIDILLVLYSKINMFWM